MSDSEEYEHSFKRKKITDYDFLRSLVSGGTAGVVSKTVIAPLERVKIIYQVREKESKIQSSSRTFTYKNMIKSLKNITREEGFFKLWRGNAIVCLRIFPYSALQFASYDSFRYVKKPL